VQNVCILRHSNYRRFALYIRGIESDYYYYRFYCYVRHRREIINNTILNLIKKKKLRPQQNIITICDVEENKIEDIVDTIIY